MTDSTPKFDVETLIANVEQVCNREESPTIRDHFAIATGMLLPIGEPRLEFHRRLTEIAPEFTNQIDDLLIGEGEEEEPVPEVKTWTRVVLPLRATFTHLCHLLQNSSPSEPGAVEQVNSMLAAGQTTALAIAYATGYQDLPEAKALEDALIGDMNMSGALGDMITLQYNLILALGPRLLENEPEPSIEDAYTRRKTAVDMAQGGVYIGAVALDQLEAAVSAHNGK